MGMRPSGRASVACALGASSSRPPVVARVVRVLGFPPRVRLHPEGPDVHPPDARQRLYTILAWAAAAVAVIPVLSSLRRRPRPHPVGGGEGRSPHHAGTAAAAAAARIGRATRTLSGTA